MSNYRINGATGDWEVVIGLEVHAQVTSAAKLFSGASTEFASSRADLTAASTASILSSNLRFSPRVIAPDCLT